MPACVSSQATALKGTAKIPGDKSISHRALIFAALASGESRIEGLLEGEDVLHTADAVRALGARVARDGQGGWRVTGVAPGRLSQPAAPLQMGNSGTGARLLMGLVATQPMRVTFIGDDSLSRRPMGRILEPVSLFGAETESAEGGRLPVTITGTGDPAPQSYEVPVPSAQVKSAFLLAALNTPGISSLIEPLETRDHSERMLAAFGADITVEQQQNKDGTCGRRIEITGKTPLTATKIIVPRDFSSAAFPLVAALLVPGSDIVIPGVGINPLRTGLLEILGHMGAVIGIVNQREEAGEPIGDLHVKSGGLKAVTPDAALAPRLIDEYPLLFVAAASASGTSVFRGLGELRVKESDRISAMVAGLAANGVAVEELEDGLVIEGCGGILPGGGRPPGGGSVAAHGDHRVAMAFLVLGAVAQNPVTLDDAAMIATSFPGFIELMNGLGCRMVPQSAAGVSRNER